MTRRHRQPLTRAAWAVLLAVHRAGGASTAGELLELVNGSWRQLLGIVSALESRGHVRLRPGGHVLLTPAGRRAAAGRFAH